MMIEAEGFNVARVATHTEGAPWSNAYVIEGTPKKETRKTLYEEHRTLNNWP
jgi:hypothetical protein